MIRLIRISSSDKGTFGVLLDGDQPMCVTMEPPWKDNEVGKSCIPDGEYAAMPHDGPKFQNVWELVVPGRDAILIHAGNFLKDTTGCILVGKSFNGYSIAQSKDALDYLRMMLPKNFKILVETHGKITPEKTNPLPWWKRIFK